MNINWLKIFAIVLIALFCAFILGYSVYNDCSYQKEYREQKSAEYSTDSLLYENLASVDSLRSTIEVMNDSMNTHFSEIDTALNKHVSTVETTAKKQSRILNQISRKLNQ